MVLVFNFDNFDIDLCEFHVHKRSRLWVKLLCVNTYENLTRIVVSTSKIEFETRLCPNPLTSTTFYQLFLFDGLILPLHYD